MVKQNKNETMNTKHKTIFMSVFYIIVIMMLIIIILYGEWVLSLWSIIYKSLSIRMNMLIHI
jgi:hypothetical protein